MRAVAREQDLAFTSYLRVGAMAAVVLVHSLSAIVGNDAIRGSATWWAGTALDLGASWSVPVFIMVSGALLLDRAPGERAAAFYRRRLKRIAIPLVVAHVGYLALRALGGEALTPATVIEDLLRVTVYTQLYFFWIVLGLYLVTPLLWHVVADRRSAAVVGAAALAWMVLVSAGAATLHTIGAPVEPWQPAVLTLWIPYLGYFILGHALRTTVLGGRWLAAAVAAFVAGELLAIWHFAAGRTIPAAEIAFGGGYQGLPVAVTAVTLYLLGRTVLRPESPPAAPRPASAARALGALTLGVFVVHLAVLALVREIPGAGYAQAAVSLPMALLQWALTLVTSFAACAVVGRIPGVRRAIGL